MTQQQELGNDIVLIKDMLLRLGDKQEDMSESLHEISISLDRLQKRILGDAEYNQKGLIQEVADIKTYINKDRANKNKLYGGLIVVAFFWTIIWEYIKTKFK
jgi:hypothetical protein